MATPHDQLIAELLDSRIPKTEREHAAAREIKRLREALAEPEQEPVAWMCADEDMTRKGYSRFSRNCEGEWNIPVYTTPPARKPLTDYQIREIDELVWKELSWEEKTFGQFALKLARAIERAHGIVND